MREHIACTLRSAAITAICLAATDVNSIGVSHTDAQTFVGKYMRNQTGGRGFTVNARDRDDRNARIITLSKHLLYHRLTNIAAFTVRGGQVHT